LRGSPQERRHASGALGALRIAKVHQSTVNQRHPQLEPSADQCIGEMPSVSARWMRPRCRSIVGPVARSDSWVKPLSALCGGMHPGVRIDFEFFELIPAYESGGQEFESLRARQSFQWLTWVPVPRLSLGGTPAELSPGGFGRRQSDCRRVLLRVFSSCAEAAGRSRSNGEFPMTRRRRALDTFAPDLTWERKGRRSPDILLGSNR
jgi:hypothetical protein